MSHNTNPGTDHPLLARLFPFLRWRKEVSRIDLWQDFVAGLTGAVVVLPQGVAFAAIAGMPPQYGLYTGMIPAIIAALFGSSRLLVSGPTTAASLVLFSSLSLLAAPGSPEYIQLALTLTLFVGMIQVSLGLVRFGALVNFISHSVVVGFTAGAGILIMASQARHFLGLFYPRQSSFHDTLVAIFSHLGETNPYAVAIGVITLLTGILVRKINPSLPYMIISMVVGSLASIGLTAYAGEDSSAIVTVGALPATLPPLSLPYPTLDNIKMLAPTALAMTLFALTEAISIARSLADKTDQEFDGNQEFIGQGISNMVGSFFSAYVATGSFNRSAMNYEAGAKTPMAAVFAGTLLIPAALFAAPLAAYLPNAAMAGILFLVAWRLIDIGHIIKIVKTSVPESVILGTTLLATLFLELQFAILLGIMLSVAIYLNRTSHPKIVSRVPDPRIARRPFVTDPSLPECPQLKILRIDGSLYFGAVNHIRSELRHILHSGHRQKYLLLVGSGINFIDMAGADFLAHLAKERDAEGGALYFYDIKENVCSRLKSGHYFSESCTKKLFGSKGDAISTIYTKLDKSICANCTARIFSECMTEFSEAGASHSIEKEDEQGNYS